MSKAAEPPAPPIQPSSLDSDDQGPTGAWPAERRLEAQPLEAGRFAPYGQVIAPVADGADYGDSDARLLFDGPQPRFYIMRVGARSGPLQELARHQRCTQCLASADHHPWWLVVAPPDPQRSRPDLDGLALFAIPAGVAIKLHCGTWHGGPFHLAASATYFNLELSDTNRHDRQLWRLPQALPLQLTPADQPGVSSLQPQ
ncbi:MAG: ureidoglycolate lyase [Synechococcaceae cyanobacterium]|nr:ureidoglycolate lyase [Synechococcaceae cyanobacterium]